MLETLAAALKGVGGVRAIVLGGSRGRGTAQAGSDYDIGLYYDGAGGLDIAALEAAAVLLNGCAVRGPGKAPGDPLMTRPGGWGEWVDGGGWLVVGGEPVDLLYRELARVDRVIDAAERGEFTIAYHVGHPHGFASPIYAGEIATCRVLHDPEGLVTARKARLEPYPEALRAAAITRFGREGRFFLEIAQKAAARGDLVYVTGCAFRAASCLLQVVFAINREWLLNEKGAAALAAGFARAPKDLRLNLEGALAELAAGPQGMLSCLRAIADLFDEAAALA
ncbi:MAG: DUF4037 domain-containing protein [Rhizomicrobium sp.]